MPQRPSILSVGPGEYRGGDELMLNDYTDPVLYCLSPQGADLRCWPHCFWWRKFECKKGKLEGRYKECRAVEQKKKKRQEKDELKFQKYWYWAYLA